MSQTFVYLKKDKQFRCGVKGYSYHKPVNNVGLLTAQEIELTWQMDEDSKKSRHLERVEDYFQQMKDNDVNCHLMSPHVGTLPDGKIIFYMEINSSFIKKLCAILPSPFIRLNGSIEKMYLPAEYVGNKRTLFDNSLQLKELMQTAEAHGNQRNSTRISCSSEELYVTSETDSVCVIIKFDVILGWSGIDPNGVKIKGGSFLQNLYGMDAFKDVAIVAGDGIEQKCHRSVIAAHSPVFAAMLSPENGMVESQTGRIELPENSEPGIHQLIRYLYGFEVTNAELEVVAVELFKTAHMYELAQMEKHLEDLILKKATKMLCPDDILGLYYYVKIIDGLTTFRCHLLRIMKSMHQKLRSCGRYKGLKSEQREILLGELLEANEGAPNNINAD